MSDWKPKRFWKNATVVAVDGGHTVHLDGRPVKTPSKAGLIVPTAAMAAAMAAEWDAQVELVDPRTMPVTRCANSAIDKVRVQHADVAAMLAEYGDSDLLCYRAADPEVVGHRQRPVVRGRHDAARALDEVELRDRIEVVRDYGELPRVGCVANQINQIFADFAPTNGYADVTSIKANAGFYCYGSVLDNETSDPTTVLPQVPADALDFSLPAAWLGGRWRCVFDTAAPRPFEARAGDPCMAAEPITLADRSLVLVRRVEAG